jgi:penicillin-binding protein 1B
MVTAVTAIEHSLNIATIALAQKVGFENVAALARSAGIVNARATPSVAIGTYNATPVQMAGAYTVFANGGVHLDPWAVSSVRSANGDLLVDMPRTAKQVLDPRSAYLTESLLENVMSFGTAAVVRGRGFTAPAAGKTGSSHDAWFAGYSSNLLCIIWVGNDDYTNLDIEGAKAAAPIWAEFMNRAIKLPQYSDMHAFTKPDGVTDVRIDRITNLPADDTCPDDFTAAFLDGTIPAGTCSRMADSSQSIVDQIVNGTSAPAPSPQETPAAPEGTAQPKKPNILKRLFGGGTQNPPPPQ